MTVNNEQFTKENYTNYFIKDLAPICPDIIDYSDSIHAIYAGLDPEFSFNIQSFISIVNQILEAINNGKTSIIFTTLDEDFIESIVIKIHEVMRHLSNLKVQCKYYYFTGAFNIEKMYNSILDTYGFTEKLNIIALDYSLYCTKSDGIFRELIVPEYSTQVKQKIFLSFNNNPRPHRVELLDNMFKEKLIDKAYYSFYGSSSHIDRKFQYINHSKLPLILNKENKTNIVSIAHDDVYYYSNSYFSLVTETFYDYHEPENSSIYISEKTYKPIALKHPFIVVGKPYILKILRELGFKTFSPYIDESYDDAKDNNMRMELIVKEINRLSKFTDEEWIAWQENVKDIVNHNHLRFMTSKTYTAQKFSDYA